MNDNIDRAPDRLNFKTISEFKFCVYCNSEIEFEFNNKLYGIFPGMQKAPQSDYQILFHQKLIENYESTYAWFDTVDELLEHEIDGCRLRDIITKVEVTDRTL